MSALGPMDGFNPILLRSSTPGNFQIQVTHTALTIFIFSRERERYTFFVLLKLHPNTNTIIVLNYLEGMSREGDEPDNTPPRSLIDPNEIRSRSGSVRNGNGALYSPAPRSHNSDVLQELANSQLSYTNRYGNGAHPDHNDDGDVESNVQDGMRSEAGDTVLPVVCSHLALLYVNLVQVCRCLLARTWTARPSRS